MPRPGTSWLTRCRGHLLPVRPVDNVKAPPAGSALKNWSLDQRTDAADESERSKNLMLGQQNLHNLIVGCGETLDTHESTHANEQGVEPTTCVCVCVCVYLQHVQGQLVGRRVRALQRQQQTRLKHTEEEDTFDQPE